MPQHNDPTLSGPSPTPARDWRRSRETGELIKLPGSGNVARLVRPSLTALVGTANGVPNPVSAAVLRLMAAPPPRDEKERLENVKRNSRALLEVAALCFVEPKLKLEGEIGEGEIAPLDLSDLDLAWIYYTFVEGAAEDIAPFRIG